MFFSKAALNENIPLKEIPSLIPHDSYEMHQQIWRFFPGKEGQPREFLYHHRKEEKRLGYYIVSLDQPVDYSGYWNIQSKPYAPLIQNKRYFYFTLRANPTIKRKDPKIGKSARHDVIMDAKKHWRETHKNSPPFCQDRQELIYKSSWEWLKRCGEKRGFDVEQSRVLVGTYQHYRFNKRNGKMVKQSRFSSKEIQFSTVDLSGILEVTDATQFQHCLFHGLGSAKGFGCGLLLIRHIKE